MSADQSEELRNDPAPIDSEHIGSEHIGSEHIGSEHIGAERAGVRSVAELWGALLPRLHHVARRLGIAAADIEDVLQDVSVVALEKCPADWNEGQVTGWMYRVTINRCHLRHRQSRQHALLQSKLQRELWAHTPFDSVDESSRSGEAAVLQAETRALVQQQLQLLPTVQHEVLVLKYYSGFNAQQIADLLNVPAATVRTRLRQARLRLAAALEQTGFEYG
jgi:RNA polymerase sigma-70 factor, ECF subfamily